MLGALQEKTLHSTCRSRKRPSRPLILDDGLVACINGILRKEEDHELLKKTKLRTHTLFPD